MHRCVIGAARETVCTARARHPAPGRDSKVNFLLSLPYAMTVELTFENVHQEQYRGIPRIVAAQVCHMCACRCMCVCVHVCVCVYDYSEWDIASCALLLFRCVIREPVGVCVYMCVCAHVCVCVYDYSEWDIASCALLLLRCVICQAVGVCVYMCLCMCACVCMTTVSGTLHSAHCCCSGCVICQAVGVICGALVSFVEHL